ncbi:MAG: hypothetical protein ACREIQ_04105 [Nitrospiria bacterium]
MCRLKSCRLDYGTKRKKYSVPEEVWWKLLDLRERLQSEFIHHGQQEERVKAALFWFAHHRPRRSP